MEWKDSAWPLALSTLAGLSTSLGGIIAIIHKPGHEVMALLLGMAIGVMATVSIVELIVRNALENDTFLVLGSALGGGMVYYILEPFFPKVDEAQLLKGGRPSPQESDTTGASHDVEQKGGTVSQRTSLQLHKSSKVHLARKNSGGGPQPDTEAWDPTGHSRLHDASGGGGDLLSHDRSEEADVLLGGAGQQQQEGATIIAQKSASLLRLGILMAITMTLHNMPEGFAVAFSAFTRLGPIMAIAIAVHNIPEGVIIAAPIYAATGSRWKALGLATASGLSEPFGALLALLLLRPFLTPERLQYLLAGTGGLMLAVCIIELWPEARSCKNDKGLLWGIVLGALVMGWTLYVET